MGVAKYVHQTRELINKVTLCALIMTIPTRTMSTQPTTYVLYVDSTIQVVVFCSSTF